MSLDEGIYPMRAHELRTIEEGKTLFALESYGAKPVLCKDFASATFFATGYTHFAFPDKREEKIGKGSQVARCTQRTPIVYDGDNILVEHIEDALYRYHLHPAMP